MKRLDLVNQHFGQWTVVNHENKKGRSGWKCVCACNKISWVTTQNLRNGVSTRCLDCCKLPKGEAAFNNLFGNYQRSARYRGFDFLLSREEAKQLFESDCRYCGQIPTAIFGERERLNGTFVYNGIDRLDSSLGYVFHNCVPCCRVCNYMKQQLSPEEFIFHIRKIAAHARV